MDQPAPLYQVTLHKSKILIPKTFTLFILSGLFYAGIMINIALLELDTDVASTAKLAALGIVILLFVLGVFLNYSKAKHGIKFYADHLEVGHQKIQYITLGSVDVKQGMLDKVFKTYTLQIDKKHKVEALPQEINVQQYLQQMINYAKSQQQQQTTYGQY